MASLKRKIFLICCHLELFPCLENLTVPELLSCHRAHWEQWDSVQGSLCMSEISKARPYRVLTILYSTLERNVSHHRSQSKQIKVTETDLVQEYFSADCLLLNDPNPQHGCLFLTGAHISDKVGRLSKALASILSRESLWEISLQWKQQTQSNTLAEKNPAIAFPLCISSFYAHFFNPSYQSCPCLTSDFLAGCANGLWERTSLFLSWQKGKPTLRNKHCFNSNLHSLSKLQVS